MKTDLYMSFNTDDYRDAWVLYVEAFREINALAIQRHLMREEEFSDCCNDLAIEKHVVRTDAGRMVGLGMLTNRLDSWPLVSPAAFELRWPVLYRARKIWYVGFVATAPDHRSGDAFRMILEQMTDGRRDGTMFVMDFCAYNEDQNHIVRGVTRTLERSGMTPAARLLDTQRFWGITFA